MSVTGRRSRSGRPVAGVPASAAPPPATERPAPPPATERIAGRRHRRLARRRLAREQLLAAAVLVAALAATLVLLGLQWLDSSASPVHPGALGVGAVRTAPAR
ncbi:MAG: hypothetical protein ACRDY0_09575 [Acidimicrobiales bacterium]